MTERPTMGVVFRDTSQISLELKTSWICHESIMSLLKSAEDASRSSSFFKRVVQDAIMDLP
jgi:hypothetical protein